MKWIAALLMLANVGLYLWSSGNQADPGADRVIRPPDVNREGMLLLSETGPSAGEDPALPDAAVSEADDGLEVVVVDSAQPVAAGETPQPAGEQGDLCFRLGPFRQPETLASATGWLDQQGLAYDSVQSESRELRAVRVYLGPYQSREDTNPVIQRLKERNLDHFVYQLDNGQVRISLGYFTQEELAGKFMTYLETLDIQARSQEDYRTLGPFSWLILRPAGTVVQAIRTRDWQDPDIGLSEVGC